MAFITSGFEHSVANMCYITLGLFAKTIPHMPTLPPPPEKDLSALTFGNMLEKNLLPVTIGNIIGGLIIALLLWYGFSKKAEKAAANCKS